MPQTPAETENGLIRAHTYAAFAGLLLSACFGLLVSIKFFAPEFLTLHPWLTWGRLRYDHTQGILHAWLGNAFLAFLYYAVPRLTRRSVTSHRLGWIMFAVWNFVAVLGGWTLVLAGISQPLEWAEFPLAIAAVIELSLILFFVQFVLPFLRQPAADIYVAGWYILGAITFTALSYPVGNLLPHILPGAMGAAFSGLWIHDAVGIWVTPIAVAVAYFVIPAVTKRPIYSHFYSMVGFWLLFLVYPLNGLHHYLYSSLPMDAQVASEVASIYQGIDVILVVTNLLLSIPVLAEAIVLEDVPLRFIWTSVVLYLVVSIQGSIQAVMPFNRFIHFSDWVIGHSHLAMIGFASFAVMGALGHVWQRIPGVRVSRRAMAWSYWLMVTGLGLMVVDLTAAGLVQATLWHSYLPWIVSVRASKPYWIFRSMDGGLLIAGFVVFAGSFFTGQRNSDEVTTVVPVEDWGAEPGRRRYWINTAYATTFGAGIVFFVVSFVALGVVPAARLHRRIERTMPVGGLEPLTASELCGRKIYAKNGCAYCHTEQVRFTPDDIRRFGPPTEAWETDREFPQMWGTRRIGPDLARESAKRTQDWQLVHLYNPRDVVPDSIMPSYPWLFDGSPSRPTQGALDLVAYLKTLGRARARLFPSSTPVMAPVAVTAMPASTGSGPNPLGRKVFEQNCSGCHGREGSGDSAGGRALRPAAFNLAGYRLSQGLVWRVLRQGVPGSAMPAWDSLPMDEFAAVAEYTTNLGKAPELAASKLYASPAVLLDAGRRVFVTHCARCHGADAAGDGRDAALSWPRPANFHLMQPSYPAAAAAIQNGVHGSTMPAWPLLTDQEVQAVTYYLRSFYGTSLSTPSTDASKTARAGQ